ncbi:MAG: hypothetical protein QM764_14005 [Chitinophagaceae bacterium]
MKRLYIKDAKLKGELYFFNPESFHKDEISYEKFDLGELQKKSLDSIRNMYNLSFLKSFDTTAVDKLYKAGYVLYSSRMVLMEQLDSALYTATFIHAPKDFETVNKDYAFLSRTYHFIVKEIMYKNKNAEPWINKKVLGTQ